MRFKTFLEATVTPYSHEQKELDELPALIKKHCSQAIEGERIYRGSKSFLKNGIFDPSAGTRKSQNTSNYYTVLLDSNPYNKDYPKRSKSFIATTIKKTAVGYGYSGSTMVLFPFDNVKIGEVNQDDLWDLVLPFSSDLRDKDDDTIIGMNPNIHGILVHLGKDKDFTPTMGELIELLKEAHPNDVILGMLSVDLIDESWEKETDESKLELVKRFIKELPKAYAYSMMGCTLSPPDRVSGKGEVWFSGKCIAITLDDYEKIKEEVEA